MRHALMEAWNMQEIQTSAPAEQGAHQTWVGVKAELIQVYFFI